MVRYRNGLNFGMPLDALSITEVQTFDYFKATTLLAVEPRIVSDELCLRVQQWIKFDRREVPSVENTRSLGICSHVNRFTISHMPNLIQCKLRHCNQKQDCRTCHSFFQCSECAAEFEVDTRDFGDRGSALIITKWLNLGRGDTPLDPKWRRHLYQPCDQRLQPSPVTKADRKGSIRGSFEREDGHSQEMLTEGNASVLRDGLY